MSPHVWFAVAASFAVFALACVVLFLTLPTFGTPKMAALGAGLALVATVLARMPAPEPDSISTHIVIALSYVGTAAAMLAFAPFGTAALAAAAFIGPLVAIWLDNRRQIAAHYLAAAIVLLLPSVLGIVDTPTLIATCTLLPPAFVHGLATLNVLELVEEQSDRLESLTMRDPLTGAGNRRMLDDRLAIELARHGAHGRALSIVALDLDGFKRLNDRHGHAAGDQLLVEVARRLGQEAGDQACVVRQGGDEFLVLAPGTDSAEAHKLSDRLQAALAGLVGTGVGSATYPADAVSADALLALADDRLLANKRARGRQADVEVQAQHLPPVTSSPPPHGLEISRDALSTRPLLWRTTGAMFLFYAVAGTALLSWSPELAGPLFGPLVACGAVVGVAVMLTRPPGVGTLPSHAVVVLSYLFPALAFVACQPGGSVAIGSAIFVGPLIAIRTQTRRQAAAHLGAATALMTLVALSGWVDTPSVLALLVQIATMVVLLVCSVIVLEASERQLHTLAELTATDPLTGLANRRHLMLASGSLLEDARANREPLSVLALDLNGFKRLNDVAGHTAGDALLVEIATRLQSAVDQRALVARQGGDEFTVVLPGHDETRAAQAAAAIHASFGHLLWHGMPISTGLGHATFPADGDELEALLEISDRRLLSDKYGSLGPACGHPPSIGLQRSE